MESGPCSRRANEVPPRKPAKHDTATIMWLLDGKHASPRSCHLKVASEALERLGHKEYRCPSLHESHEQSLAWNYVLGCHHSGLRRFGRGLNMKPALGRRGSIVVASACLQPKWLRNSRVTKAIGLLCPSSTRVVFCLSLYLSLSLSLFLSLSLSLFVRVSSFVCRFVFASVRLWFLVFSFFCSSSCLLVCLLVCLCAVFLCLCVFVCQCLCVCVRAFVLYCVCIFGCMCFCQLACLFVCLLVFANVLYVCSLHWLLCYLC